MRDLGRWARAGARWLLALPLAVLLHAAPVRAFTPGDVYWAPGDCFSTCGLFDVTSGGDQQGATPFATIGRTPGQIAWDASLFAYVTQFDSDSVIRIDGAGGVTSFATGLDGTTGVLVASDGRILAASYGHGAVYDITGGGDFSAAVPFATGFAIPRNLLELDTGELLVADQSRRAVYDIAAGGDFTSATPFASWSSSSPYDLVQDASGRIYASTDAGVFDITGGGDFSAATPHASGANFLGLAIDAQDRLLASDFDSGDVFDITAPGNYAGAAPFASNLDGLGDTALDRVPGTPPPVIPILGALGTGLLAALLAATARTPRR